VCRPGVAIASQICISVFAALDAGASEHEEIRHLFQLCRLALRLHLLSGSRRKPSGEEGGPTVSSKQIARKLHNARRVIRSFLRRSAILPPPSVLAVGAVWTASMRPWSHRRASQITFAGSSPAR
jgi:hypothetical protein